MNNSDDNLSGTLAGLEAAIGKEAFADLVAAAHVVDDREAELFQLSADALKEIDRLEAENAALRATVATLTAERDRLKACAEHYEDDSNWARSDEYRGDLDYYLDGNGPTVAREALAGTKEGEL